MKPAFIIALSFGLLISAFAHTTDAFKQEVPVGSLEEIKAFIATVAVELPPHEQVWLRNGFTWLEEYFAGVKVSPTTKQTFAEWMGGTPLRTVVGAGYAQHFRKLSLQIDEVRDRWIKEVAASREPSLSAAERTAREERATESKKTLDARYADQEITRKESQEMTAPPPGVMPTPPNGIP